MTASRPASLADCLHMDDTPYLSAPGGLARAVLQLKLDRRLSMRFWMRFAQYCHAKAEAPGPASKAWGLLALWAQARNKTRNAFEHAVDPRIEAGVNFHHIGVCVTSGAVIESGVHIGRNVTFGTRHGGAPTVRKDAYICSHAIVLGPITIGEKAIVAPGAVVIHDVPARKVATGVPAAITGDVTDSNYEV